jgi:hypothetical protein
MRNRINFSGLKIRVEEGKTMLLCLLCRMKWKIGKCNTLPQCCGAGAGGAATFCWSRGQSVAFYFKEPFDDL